MSEASIWIVGDWRHPDFSSALNWLDSQASCKRFDAPAEALSALRSTEQQRDPAALVLVQARPGQFANRDVERLHAATPLARLVALVGPWCEGEGRSGHPWPGVVRVPWRTWQSGLARALTLNGAIQGEATPLPRTASDIEHVEASAGGLGDLRPFAATAAVCTENRASFECIADGLAQFGIDSVLAGESPSSSVDLVIIDGWEQLVLSRRRPPSPGAISPPHLLLLHFPRETDFARAADMEIAAVLAHPLVLADLAATLGRMLPACRLVAGSRTLTGASCRK